MKDETNLLHNVRNVARDRLGNIANYLGNHRVTRWFSGDHEENVRPAYAQGFIAAIFIAIGSWGVGFLPNSAESLFSGTTILVPLRIETGGVLISAILLILGCMLLMRAWLRLGQRTNLATEKSVTVIARGVWLWTFPLLFSFPIFSRDVYSYLAQGQLYVLGGNPYEEGVSQISGWFMTGADGLWAESYSPYGPLFLFIAGLFWMLSLDSPEIGFLLFRMLNLLSMWVLMKALTNLSIQTRNNAAFTIWVVTANPLFLIIMIAAAHNDVLMLALLLLSCIILSQGKLFWGMGILALSIGVKPISLVVAPFLIFLVLRRDAIVGIKIKKKILLWIKTVLTLGLVLLFLGGATGLWFGWFGAMFTSGANAFPYAPVGLIGLALGWLGTFVGFELTTVASFVYLLARISAAIVLIWWAIKTHRDQFKIRDVYRDAAFVLFIVVLSAPIIQPWYLLWILPLVILWGPRMQKWLRWLYLGIAFLVLTGVVEQFNVAQWISLSAIQITAGIIGLMYLLYIVFLDPKTSIIFRVK